MEWLEVFFYGALALAGVSTAAATYDGRFGAGLLGLWPTERPVAAPVERKPRR
jgi:hypothetical protein